MKAAKDHKFRVLIVDDQAMDIANLNFMAINLGFSVTLAFDGEDAWALAQDNRYDLIILDWHMEHMPGWTFLQHLETYLQSHSNDARTSENVVIHTGDAMSVDEFSAKTKFRILDVWQKPMTPVELMKRMRRVREQIGA